MSNAKLIHNFFVEIDNSYFFEIAEEIYVKRFLLYQIDRHP